MPKLLIVTDAWRPQINGVVRSIEHLVRDLQALDVEVDILSPAEFRTVPMPGYPEIRLALATPGGFRAASRNRLPISSRLQPRGRSACWRAASR
jgi:hypothetical protein